MPNDGAIEALTAAASVSFTLSVSDGALSDSKTLNVALNGVNDTPAVSGAVAGTATEDGAAVSLDALANASERDAGQTLSVASVPVLPAGVSYDATTHSFTLDPANAAFQHLAKDATAIVTVNYAVSDGIAATPASVSWTVTGINDAPVAQDKADAATEGGAAISGNVTATDADDGASLGYNLIDPAPAGLTFNADGSYSFNPDVNAYDALAEGATQDVFATYQVSDGLATSTATLKVTVTGSNDAPTITADPQPDGDPVFDDNEHSLTLAATLAFGDVDLADTHTVISVTALGPDLGQATAVIGQDSTGTGSGSISLGYHVTEQDVMNGGGEIPDQLQYLVTIGDNHGGTASKVVSIPLAQIIGGDGGGNNQAPVISGPVAPNFIISQQQVVDNPFVSGDVFAQGVIYFTDPDPGQHHQAFFGMPTMTSHAYLSPTLPPQNNLPGPVAIGIFNSVYIIEPNGNAPGEIHWNYVIPEAAIRELTSGEQTSAFFPITLMDSSGGQDTSHILRINVIGQNEVPFLLPPDTNLPPNPDLGMYMLPSDNVVRAQNQQAIPIYEPLLVTGSNSHHTVTGQITYVDPDNLDIPGVPKNSVSMHVNDFSHTGETDFNALIAPLMNGFSYWVEDHVTYGVIHWTYDIPDSALDFIAQDQVQTVSATFSIGGQSGGALSAVNIDLHGGNDAPVIAGPDTTTITVSHNNGSASGQLTFLDPDWYPDGHSVQFQWHDPNNHGSVLGGTNVEDGRGDGGIITWQYAANPMNPNQHDGFDIILRDANQATTVHHVEILLV